MQLREFNPILKLTPIYHYCDKPWSVHVSFTRRIVTLSGAGVACNNKQL